MFLKNLFAGFRRQTLRETYEKILSKEYGLPIDRYGYEEDPQDYPQFESITETEQYAFAQLDSGQTRAIPNYYWRNMLAILLDSIPNRSEVERREFFIGQIPDPRFNACVVPITNNRFLILMNAGLMLFLFRMSRIFIASSRFRFLDVTLEPEISLDDACRLSQENLDAIFDNRHCCPLQLDHPVMIKTSQLLCEAIELFTIAHELGHVFSQGKIKEPRNEELMADRLGYHFYRGILDSLAQSWEAPNHIARPLLAATPHLFFILADKLEERAKAKGIEWTDTHPSGRDRSYSLFQENKSLMEQVDTLTMHFYRMVSETM